VLDNANPSPRRSPNCLSHPSGDLVDQSARGVSAPSCAPRRRRRGTGRHVRLDGVAERFGQRGRQWARRARARFRSEVVDSLAQ